MTDCTPPCTCKTQPLPTPVEVAAVVRSATSACAWAFATTIAAFVAIAYLIVTL